MNHGDTEITEKIIGAAIEVHRHLGPGLLESVYEAVLAYELAQLSLFVERQKPVPITYKGLSFEEGYRLDYQLQSPGAHAGPQTSFQLTSVFSVSLWFKLSPP